MIRAVGLALRQVPAANASWSDDAIILWERADIAMAVALDDGLITPIIRGADLKGLQQIAAETKDLAQRARAGKLKLEEFQGGTFSISNLGMFGVSEFTAVINPPQGCILAVGAGAPRPVVKDGQLAVATVMSCTLSCDHRAVDGAVGAQVPQRAFKRLIDEPSPDAVNCEAKPSLRAALRSNLAPPRSSDGQRVRPLRNEFAASPFGLLAMTAIVGWVEPRDDPSLLPLDGFRGAQPILRSAILRSALLPASAASTIG